MTESIPKAPIPTKVISKPKPKPKKPRTGSLAKDKDKKPKIAKKYIPKPETLKKWKKKYDVAVKLIKDGEKIGVALKKAKLNSVIYYHLKNGTW